MRPVLLCGFALLLSAMTVSAQRAGDPFEPYGSRDRVRKAIADAYRAEMKEDMPAAALDEAVGRALQNFERTVAREAQQAVEDARHRREVGEFLGGEFTLQVRAGAGGGNPNRISMIRKTSQYVDEVSGQSLALGGTIDMHESSKAFSSGGYIPKGKVLVITRIDIRGSAAGDSNGHGEMIVRVAGTEVVSIRDNPKAQAECWKERLVVRPGEEDRVLVEVANSSECEAVFRGFVADEAWADPDHREALTAERRQAVDDLVSRLDDNDIGRRAAAQRELLLAGPAVADYLRTLDISALSIEAKSRIDAVLEVFGGGK